MVERTRQMIKPAEFPELSALAWNRDPARPIALEEAFALYERNWRFIDQERLTEKERAFIADLTTRFGHGRMLAG